MATLPTAAERHEQVRQEHRIHMQEALQLCLATAGLSMVDGRAVWSVPGTPAATTAPSGTAAARVGGSGPNAFDQARPYLPWPGAGMPASTTRDIERLVASRRKQNRCVKIAYAVTAAIILAILGVEGYGAYLALKNR